MAGRSPASRSSRATTATVGVLPRPPMARLPTLTTGARPSGPTIPARKRSVAVAGVVVTSGAAERADDPAGTGGQDLFDGVERPRLRAAVGIDQGAGGGAQACPGDRIVEQPHHHLLELATILHLNGRVLAEELGGNLREVVHVRAEDDRLAVDGRLQDVVPALRDQAAADEDDRRNLQQVGQLADRVEHDDVSARLAVDEQVGPPDDPEALGARKRDG